MLGRYQCGAKGGKRYTDVRAKQSKADVFKDGVVRSLVEADSCLCQLKTFLMWKEMSCDSAIGQSNVFGAQLRTRLSGIVKTASLANGVFDSRIDTPKFTRRRGAFFLYSMSTSGRDDSAAGALEITNIPSTFAA